MRDAVTKSSLRHSVKQTKFSTSELAEDSEKERPTPASGILVVLTNSPTGKSCEIRGEIMKFIKSLHSLSWENRYCHTVTGIEDVNQCDLYPTNTDIDGSPMKCCSVANRSTCSRQNLVTPNLASGPSTCGRGWLWSRFLKKCFRLIRVVERIQTEELPTTVPSSVNNQ